MKQFPILKTERLKLKQLSLKDSKLITEYLQDREMSEHTTTIPFPYTEKDAIWWINNSFEKFKNDKGFVFGIFLNETNILIGTIDLNINNETKIGNFGYWTAKAFWDKGYMTEALKVVLNFGFSTLNLKEITAVHSVANPASGKVMLKAGMTKTENVLKLKMSDGSIRSSVHYQIYKF